MHIWVNPTLKNEGKLKDSYRSLLDYTYGQLILESKVTEYVFV